MRQPSSLISCAHSSPAGTFSTSSWAGAPPTLETRWRVRWGRGGARTAAEHCLDRRGRSSHRPHTVIPDRPPLAHVEACGNQRRDDLGRDDAPSVHSPSLGPSSTPSPDRHGEGSQDRTNSRHAGRPATTLSDSHGHHDNDDSSFPSNRPMLPLSAWLTLRHPLSDICSTTHWSPPNAWPSM